VAIVLRILADAHEFESGQLYPERIPSAATALLEAGFDSPTLRVSAGADHADPVQQQGLFRQALIELGALPLSESEVGRRLFRLWAERIVDGEVTPLQGARAMWMLEIDRGVVLPATMSQYGALDEEDFPTSDVEQAYERDIREAAAKWLTANPR
jgi:DNA-directed RNA polymerase beta' subunit